MLEVDQTTIEHQIRLAELKKHGRDFLYNLYFQIFINKDNSVIQGYFEYLKTQLQELQQNSTILSASEVSDLASRVDHKDSAKRQREIAESI